MVLIYIAANNDLRTEALNSVNKIESAYEPSLNLLVYLKIGSESSVILKVKSDNTSEIVSDTIAIYGNENSSDPYFLSRVVNDARKLSPASSYGLVLWSHASSWAPPLEIRLKSFGQDNGLEMDIIDLKQALPSDFRYIIFDACSMASIEAIYELKNNARYILASPTEVLSSSYPYGQIVPYLFGGKEELIKIGQSFISYYQSLGGEYASAAVSLIDTDSLSLLARKMKVLLSSKNLKIGFDKSVLQRLDFDPNSRVKAYDYLDFLRKGFEPEDYYAITEQVNAAVLYRQSTEAFLNKPITHFSGLSIYLPESHDPLHSYYSKLEWYSASGMSVLFGN
ncbi:clostripain-related cysteine peptidase [Parapedobacter sp. 10938]|uniref:clostripain-related cysteine peptidase n=1 Tax=Parapedobacter flavus TaxID=3110225 RepID=UPI002DB84A6F|nr:clostripain-related cysteine peptidase [Parapedobacter sp. 10938]MEC3878256.1 clostripain-related cysteine peptidase [Parapedobacter sp. 10938]